MISTIAIQQSLLSRGYSVGSAGADGIMGGSTRKAISAFQKAHGLPGSGTPGPKTFKLLGLSDEKAINLPGMVYAPWYEELLRKKGLHEVSNYEKLKAWLKSDKNTLGDPRKLPWCGDAIQTCIALTIPDEPLPANPYLARNWLKFGVPVIPTLGCVMVFWRGSRNGTSGHVGLYAGEDAKYYYILGGNQSNAITIAKLDKARFLGARWPKTEPLPKTTIGGAIKGVALTTNEA